MTISSKITGTIAKLAVGGGGLFLVGYDAHCYGKAQATNVARSIKTDVLAKQAIADTKMDSPSVVKSKIRKGIFNFYAQERFTDFFTNGAGYVKGAFNMLGQNILPLGLSVGTLITKGIFSKLCGIGLIAYGGVYLLQEFFGIGKSEHKTAL